MAAYPSFAQTHQTKEEKQDKIDFERASNGSLRGRALWVSEKLTLALEHVLTRVELDELLAFYHANRLLPVDVPYYAGGNQVYSMYFEKPPEVARMSSSYWIVKVRMLEA